jgi:hypothetical protein
MRNILDSGASLLLVALVLLSIFRFLDERLPESGNVHELTGDSFGNAIGLVLGSDKSLKEISIFAQTSSKYLGFIVDRSQEVRIDTLRILISDPKYAVSEAPLSQRTIDDTTAELNNTINSWCQLVADGVVKNLEIRKFSFPPTFHFMIVGKENALFGLFRPDPKTLPKYRTATSFFFSSKHPAAKHMVEDLEMFFDSVFKNFSSDCAKAP